MQEVIKNNTVHIPAIQQSIVELNSEAQKKGVLPSSLFNSEEKYLLAKGSYLLNLSENENPLTTWVNENFLPCNSVEEGMNSLKTCR